MRALLLCGCALLFVAPRASATIYRVAPDSSGDVLNIQAAIDAAVSGDEIVLADGTFSGDGNWDLNFGTKDLVLRSVNGYEATIIDCGCFDNPNSSKHRGIILEGRQSAATRIEGVTVQSSYSTGDGGAFRIVGASPVIRNVRLQRNPWVGLQADSPCATANGGECALIGALEVACGPTAVEGRTWGSIKALYR